MPEGRLNLFGRSERGESSETKKAPFIALSISRRNICILFAGNVTVPATRKCTCAVALHL